MDQRANNFDALRLTAAMMVLVSHQFAMMGRPEPLVHGLATWGTVGVAMFFSMSGYLVVQSWERDPHPVRFLLRRVARLWPLIIAVTLVLSAIVMVVRPSERYQAMLFLSNVFLSGYDWKAFPLHPHKSLHGPWWTISYEVGCYLTLVVVAMVSRHNFKRVLLGAALLLLPLYLAVGGETGIVRAHLARHLWVPYFLAFFSLGALLHHWPGLRGPGLTLGAVTLGLAVLGLTSETTLGLLLIVPASSVFVGERSWPILNAGGRYGDMSYGVYLWAWPVQQWWVSHFDGNASFAAALFVALISTLALAWASWHLVEKPALRLKPSKGEAWRFRRALPLGAPTESGQLREHDALSSSGGRFSKRAAFQPSTAPAQPTDTA